LGVKEKMKIKLLLKAIGVVLLCLLALAAATFVGTLAFIHNPAITTIVIAALLITGGGTFSTYMAYIWLEDRG